LATPIQDDFKNQLDHIDSQGYCKIGFEVGKVSSSFKSCLLRFCVVIRFNTWYYLTETEYGTHSQDYK
jgi:hypothetical protein